MEKTKAFQIAKDLFKHYPDQKSFFITSDEQAFFDASPASSHAATLQDDTIVEVLKEEVEGKQQAPSKEDAEKAIADATNKIAKAEEKLKAAEQKGNASAKIKAQEELEKAKAALEKAKASIAE